MQTTVKTCFKCLNKLPLEAFYKHSAMGDGHLNKCKECTKKDVLQHRLDNLEKVRAYDRFRGGQPHRVVARKEYAQTPQGKLSHAKALRNNRLKNPNKAKTRNIFTNAMRDGKVTKLPCFICGELKVEGHHPDYDRPLDVVWLCNKHHQEIHKAANETRRAERLAA